MPDWIKLILYFFIGGTIVSLSSYIGAQGKGFLAAFVSTFPAITGLTIVLIYLNGGVDPAYAYAKHLLWFVPPWVIYVGALIFSVPRYPFWPSYIGALTLYVAMIAIMRLYIR